MALGAVHVTFHFAAALRALHRTIFALGTTLAIFAATGGFVFAHLRAFHARTALGAFRGHVTAFHGRAAAGAFHHFIAAGHFLLASFARVRLVSVAVRV